MKKVFNLSIFVFLLAIIVSAPSVYAKSENSGSGKGSFEFGLSGGVKVEDDSSSDDNSNSDDSSSSSSSSSALEVEADIFTNETIVKVEINDQKSIFSTSAKTRDEIVAEVVSKYPTLTKAEVEAVLNLETENRDSRPSEKTTERSNSGNDDKEGYDRKNNSSDDNSIGAKIKASFFGKSERNDDSKREDSFVRKMSAEFVFKRFEEAVKHIEKFIVRIETAAGKFKAEGKDVSLVSASLENAKTDLVQAKDFHAKAKLEWESRRDESKDMVKVYLDSTKQELKSAFENLRKALVALKDLRDNSNDDNSGKN